MTGLFKKPVDLRRFGDDADGLALLWSYFAELHYAGYLGEQRMVFAHADVVASVEPGAALTDDDAAASHCFAAVRLYAQSLGMRVAAVTG